MSLSRDFAGPKLTAVVLVWALTAWAQSSKEACAAASEEAQRLRSEGRWVAAQAQLTRCARAECPKVVRQFCEDLLTELAQSVPTVVFAARDAAGQDLADVTVRVDGATVLERLTGLPQPLDPGPHHLEARSPGHLDAVLDVVVLVGDRNRVVTLELPVAPAPVPVVEPVAPPQVTRARPVPALVWVSTGVAVAGLGAALGLVLSAKADEAALRQRCAPACTEAQVEPLRVKGALSDVGLGVGLLGAGAALVLFFTRPEVEVPVTLGIDPRSGFVGAAFRARF